MFERLATEPVTIGSNLMAISLICFSIGVFLPFFLCHGWGFFLGLNADFLRLDFLVAILSLLVTAGFRLRVVCFLICRRGVNGCDAKGALGYE